MMEGGRAAPYLGLAFIFLFVGLGGWGAFAYSLSSARQQEDALRAALAQQEKLTAELGQVRTDLTRTRQALERAQADLIVARAEVEQLKTRPTQPPAIVPTPVPLPRTRQGR
jgi:hypothetical protein